MNQSLQTLPKQRSLGESMASAAKTGSLFFILFKILDMLAYEVQKVLNAFGRYGRAGIKHAWNKHVKKDPDSRFAITRPKQYVNPLDTMDWSRMDVEKKTNEAFGIFAADLAKCGEPPMDAGKQMELKDEIRQFLSSERDRRCQ